MRASRRLEMRCAVCRTAGPAGHSHEESMTRFVCGVGVLLATAVSVASAAPPRRKSSCKPIRRGDTGWTQLAVPGRPVLDRFGNPGYLAYTSFVDVAKCNLLSGIICPVDQISYVADCRPATSQDGGASWKLHDVPQFDIGESDLFFRRPCVARSPANPNRIWYSTARHAWYATPPQGGMWRSDDNGETWTENLFAGQPGSSGMPGYILPDPDDADRVFIGRGYDFGNVAVSTDAGATFTGHLRPRQRLEVGRRALRGRLRDGGLRCGLDHLQGVVATPPEPQAGRLQPGAGAVPGRQRFRGLTVTCSTAWTSRSRG